MSDLWAARRDSARRSAEPLAVRMRPRTLEEFVGQRHIVGEGTLLRRMLAADRLTSVIFCGPPGTGKTTLAEVVAGASKAHFVQEHAASVGVKRIREIADEARRRLELGQGRTILFLDEIHRFSRSQQDVLLDDVERGVLVLIGATTENPMFAVNSALVSRSTVFRFEPLTEEDVAAALRRAIADPERGFGRLALQVSDEAIAHWARTSDGDARRAITALEVAVLSSGGPALRAGSSGLPAGSESRPTLNIDLAVAQESIQQKALAYDPTGDEHYDSISAMIKSVRGSDPDAAVYWIARMLEAGEDIRFIARRLAILASEDIGNADPRGIMVAAATWEIVERIGMPEARIPLSQCAIYLALAPKSNASYIAINEAAEDVREGRTFPVPMFLRDGNKPVFEGSARDGRGYEYSHDAANRTSIGGVTAQSYLGVDKAYYRPVGIGVEKMLKERLEEVKRAREEGKA